MNLCKYSDIAGKPREGLHSIRLFDIAIIDVILTIVGTLILYQIFSYFFEISNYVSRLGLICIAFVSGIIMHRLFCVRTKIDTILFPNEK